MESKLQSRKHGFLCKYATGMTSKLMTNQLVPKIVIDCGVEENEEEIKIPQGNTREFQMSKDARRQIVILPPKNEDAPQKEINKTLLKISKEYFQIQDDIYKEKNVLVRNFLETAQLTEIDLNCTNSLLKLLSKNIVTISLNFSQQLDEIDNKAKKKCQQLLLKLEEILTLEEDNKTIYRTAVNSEKYIVGTLLGKGSYGRVYKVQNDQGEQFAVKIIEQDAQYVQDILNEIVIPVKFQQHKGAEMHVPILYNVFRRGKELFLLTEYCSGGTLQDLLDKGPLSEPQVATYAKQLLNALKMLHSFGFIHRDLKPNNIMFQNYKGYQVIKLIDFGYTKYIRDDFTGSNCGAVLYKAPEVLQQVIYNYSLDFYNFGVILYEMLSLHIPYLKEAPEYYRRKDRTQVFKDLLSNNELTFPKFISKAAQELLAKLLQKDASKRLCNWNDVEKSAFLQKSSSVKAIRFMKSLSPDKRNFC